MKLFTKGVISLLISVGNHAAGFLAKSQTPRSAFVNLPGVDSHFFERQTSRMSASTPDFEFSEYSEAPESLQATLESAFENAFEATPERDHDKLQRSSSVESLRVMEKDELINNLVLASIMAAVGMALIHIDASFPHDGVSNILRIKQVPMEAWNSYESILRESPIATKAATSATVYTIGDVLAQQTEGAGLGQLDRARILRSLLAGGIGHGPLSHFWYNFCDNIFTNVLHVTQWWSFIPKIVIDQTIWGTIWNNTYILMLGLMKFDSGKNVWSDMKRSTIPLFISGLRLWPLAHCVTYGLIPVENRLAWVDLVEILWVTILASQAASISKQPEEPAFHEEPATIEAVSLAE